MDKLVCFYWLEPVSNLVLIGVASVLRSTGVNPCLFIRQAATKASERFRQMLDKVFFRYSFRILGVAKLVGGLIFVNFAVNKGAQPMHILGAKR